MLWKSFVLHSLCIVFVSIIPPFYATVMLVSDLFAFAVFLIYTSLICSWPKKLLAGIFQMLILANFSCRPNTALVSKLF